MIEEVSESVAPGRRRKTAEPPVERLERMVREAEVARITGLSRTTRLRLQRDGKFPKSRQISPRCSAWVLSEIEAWLAERVRG